MIAVYMGYGYCFVGAIIAVWFSFFKVAKIDEAAAGTSVWFKLIIMPATLLIWPVVCSRLLTMKTHA